MAYYDATKALLSVGEAKQRKKDARWNKFKDVAGLGMDIWNKLTKVPEEKELMTFQHGLGEQSADAKLQRDQRWLDYQQQHPNKPADQLYREWLMTPEGQKAQQDALEWERKSASMQHGFRMSELEAGKRGGMSEKAWTAYKNAIEQAQQKFLELDANGNVTWKKGITQDQVKQFLYGFATSAFVETADIGNLKMAFDQWVNDPSLPMAQGMSMQQNGSVDINAILQGIADLIKTTKESDPNIDLAAPAIKGGVETMDQPIGGGLTMGMAAGPLAGWGAEFQKGAKQDTQEQQAADELSMMRARVSPEDQKIIDWAVPELKNPGKSTQWDAIYAALQALRNKYQVLRKLPGKK